MSKLRKLLCKVTDADVSTAMIIVDEGAYRAYPADFHVFLCGDGGMLDSFHGDELKDVIAVYGRMATCKLDDCCTCRERIAEKENLKGSYQCI